MLYTGNYFDGKSSVPRPVSLSITEDNLTLYIEEEGKLINWSLINCNIKSLNSSEKIIVSHGKKTNETLEFKETEFPEIAERLLNRESLLSQSYQILKRYNAFQIFAVGLTIIIGSIYIYTQYLSPWIGTQAIKLIPQNVEVKIGDAIIKNFDIEDANSDMTRYLNEFMTACGYQSDYPIHINYIDDEVVNAFALPGGHIIVHQGLIDIMDCSDQLAGLLGHELAHINQRHSMKTLAQSLSSYMVFSVLTGDVAGASSIFLDQASQMNQLANSRSHEKEADIVGHQYMINNKLDPVGLRDLLVKLQQENSMTFDSVEYNLDRGILEFMRTHPSSEKRIEFLDKQATQIAVDQELNNKLDAIWQKLKS